MRSPVAAPPVQSSRYNLLAAAPTVTSQERWTAGVTWTPAPCGPGESGTAACDDSPSSVDFTRTPGADAADPFYVWATDTCTARADDDPIDGRPAAEARTRAQLEAVQSFHIARELWTGDINGSNAPVHDLGPGSYLADADTTKLTAPASTGLTAVGEAIALVEQAALSCSAGRRVMLHLPVLIASLADVTGGQISRDTGVLTTAAGSIVSVDAGYPGTPPDGTSDTATWIYATTVPVIRLDAVDFRDAFDPLKNDRVSIARRLALYQLDRCCRFGISTKYTRISQMEP